MSDTEDFDVEAEYQKLLADADLKANSNWLNITTQEDHAKEVKRLTELQKKDAEKLHELNKQASEMLAKHKAEEAKKAEELTDDELDKLLAEYSEGGKTRRHKMRSYKKKHTHKKKRTYRKKSMNKKKRANRTTHRRRH